MKKATHETDRSQIKHFQQIINIGPKMEGDFHRLGIRHPSELASKDPWKMYVKIAKVDGLFHDPCVLDCYIAAVDFMKGNPPRQWWDYTEQRKSEYGQKISKLKAKF